MATDFCYGQSRRSSAGALHRGSELDRPVEKMITAPGTKLGSYEIRYRRGAEGAKFIVPGVRERGAKSPSRLSEINCAKVGAILLGESLTIARQIT